MSELKRYEPWLTEPALSLLREILINEFGNVCDPCKANVFEFGSGAGDQWLADRCHKLTTVEHDPSYFIEKQTERWSAVLAMRPYNHIIDLFDDGHFDIIIVDGRDRVKCIQSSISKLKPGGWLILDNSERPEYAEGIALMKDWNRIDCRQQRPDKYNFTYPDWTTSIFIKPI